MQAILSTQTASCGFFPYSVFTYLLTARTAVLCLPRFGLDIRYSGVCCADGVMIPHYHNTVNNFLTIFQKNFLTVFVRVWCTFVRIRKTSIFKNPRAALGFRPCPYARTSVRVLIWLFSYSYICSIGVLY